MKDPDKMTEEEFDEALAKEVNRKPAPKPVPKPIPDALKMTDEEFKHACDNIKELRGPAPALKKVAGGRDALDMTDEEFAKAEVELRKGKSYAR